MSNIKIHDLGQMNFAFQIDWDIILLDQTKAFSEYYGAIKVQFYPQLNTLDYSNEMRLPGDYSKIITTN